MTEMFFGVNYLFKLFFGSQQGSCY